jgi:hypothetical protein
MTHRFAASLFSLVASLAIASLAPAANITWTGGDATWNDGAGNNANWNPADEPDAGDVAIFITNNTIEMGSNNEIAGLTMSSSSTLNVLNKALTINGPTTITGSGTRLFLDGGSLTISQAGAPVASIATATSGTFTGNGEVSSTEPITLATTVFDNNGTLSATNPSTIIITPPAAATLHFAANDAEARIDLDGSSETGVVSVGRNQTLDVDIAVADIFNGEMSMFQNTKLDIASAWILGAGATIDIDNGATGGIGGAAAGTSTIAGGSFAQNSGTITVLDVDGTLQFDAPFSMNGGTLTNNGHVIFNQTATIAAAANFAMVGSADLTVGANRTVTINQTNINLDGSNTLGTVITINSQGRLNLNVTDYDSDSATNAFDGTINLNSGLFNPTTGDAAFVMDGVLNMNATGALSAEWNGEPVNIGNDVGVLDADVNVTGDDNPNSQGRFFSTVNFKSDADVDVPAGASLFFNGIVNFDTVNGGNNGQFTGAGTMSFSEDVNVNEAATLNMVGGTVDLDGNDSTGDFIDIDAPLVINAATVASFGRVNAGGGTNTLDINSNVGTGSLTVNLDNPADEWTLNAAGVMNLVNDAGGGTLLAGSDVNINGTVNVTGGVGTTARVDLAGTVNVAAASALTLQGGSLADPNRLEGGTVNGPGTFAVATGRALRGFGTINTTVNYAGTAELLADDGELKINGNVVDAGKIGTADADGALNVVNAWNTAAIDTVILAGGELKGGTVTVGNANGIQGHGTITSRVINSSKMVATTGTLTVQTAGNDNDWDGAGNVGELQALGGDLEMVDTTGPVPPVRSFGGRVRAINGHQVFANGFALDFLPGSSLELEDGATYRASSSTDIGGTVTGGAGADATNQVANNFFLTFETGSATTLNGDVTLLNNNINIEQGAVFSGGGALTIADGSHMVADNQADIGVLLDMQGAFRPGNFNGIGRVELLDMQMASTSELFVELIGTGLNQYDRLVADGDVIVDGSLNIDIDEVSPGVPFVPVLGNTFNIITGNTVTGQFDFADVSGMPNGLTFHINYLPNAVQLQVVNKPLFSADFDEDGDVDATDFAIWDNAFDLNQLGDADGDNDSDGNDFLLWQQQLGSKPAVAAGGAVPEPAAVLLAAAMLLTAALAGGPRRDRLGAGRL